MTLHCYVIAEVIYSTVRECHEAITWSQAVTVESLAAAASWLHWSDSRLSYMQWCHGSTLEWLTVKSYAVMPRLYYGSVTATLWLWLWLLHQPGQISCYSCHASQERIHMSAVPMAPYVIFQALSSSFACLGFSKQCKQCEKDQQYTL